MSEQHLVLCPGCGYSFWTTEEIEGSHGCWKLPPSHPDFHDVEKNSPLPWLTDEDAIEFVAMPELFVAKRI